VRWAGKRIRVNAQLISVADGFHLWSERYDREPSDAFEIQDEICRKIVDKLQVELGTGRSLVKRYTENVDAYNLYLKGTYHLNRHTAANFEKAKEYYSQAVALDPNYSLAWVGLAFHYHYLGLFGYMQPKTANAKSSQATLKAIELDDSLAQAHAITAMLWANDFDWKGAEREFRRALELDPESFEVWGNYEYFYLIPMLQLDEAVAESKRALELDPLSAPMQWRLGHRYYLKREWDRAIEQFRNTLELDPHYAAAHFFLALADSQAGRLKPDISTIETVVRSGGRTPVSLQLLGWAYAVADNIIEAQDIIDELRELAQRTYVAPSSFAWIYMGLGDIEEAFEWFENAVDERDGFILHLPVDPVYDPLRSHPRYQDLLRKMNLEL
jgi:Tfp pilus assembly protein PilF